MNDGLCGVITNSAGEINSKPSVKPVRWIHACLSVPDDRYNLSRVFLHFSVTVTETAWYSARSERLFV